MLVAFSGGVDSAVVAVAARRMLGRDRALAVLGVSPSLSSLVHERARAIATEFDLPLREVATDELADPGYVANAPSRCYFCKRELWTRLGALADAEGLAAVADGTNADDLGEHRPGGRAASERGVVSPLAEAGLTKTEVRGIARALGLPNWDAPAAPCLASRVLYGLEVTPRRLQQVERAEDVLRSVGVTGDCRVRHRGDEARIEVMPDQLGLVRAWRERVVDGLRAAGFTRVTLDLTGYRRGSLLHAAGVVEDLATAEPP
jgi:pyridinium-3,5-biscarboxylic acid mononucleotide sulfurtransferase